MAIVANELRVGAWFLDNTGNPIRIETILRGGGHASNGVSPFLQDYMVDEILPIPLTPEILAACGFEKRVEAYGKDLWSYIYVKDNFQLYFKPHGCEVEFAPHFETLEERNHICTLSYLHLLQNLFWCLTGTELPVNLKQPIE